MTEGVLWVWVLFGTTHVGSNDEATAISKNLLQRGERCTDAGVIGNLETLVQRNVEIYTHKCLLSGKIELVKCHVTGFFNGFNSFFSFFVRQRYGISSYLRIFVPKKFLPF